MCAVRAFGLLDVHEHLWNAAHQVPQLLKKQVLTRKARDADVYWSTLGIAERSA